MVPLLARWFDQPMSLTSGRSGLSGPSPGSLAAFVSAPGAVRRLLLCELGAVALALIVFALPPIVMHADGLWITGPIVEVSDDQTVTIEDPETEFRYETEMSGDLLTGVRSIGDVVTVVVHPTEPTTVLTPMVTYLGAQGLLVATVLPLAWPLAWWALRRRMHHPAGCDTASKPCSGLSVASLVAVIVILLAPPMVPGVDRPEAFFGNLWIAIVPTSLALAALALNRSWRRPDDDWALAMAAIGLTLAGFALWIAEHV